MQVLGERSGNGHQAGCPLLCRTCKSIESAEYNQLPANNVSELFSTANCALFLSQTHPHESVHTHTTLHYTTLLLCREYPSLEEQGGEVREESDGQHTASPGFQVCFADLTHTHTHAHTQPRTCTHTNTHARAHTHVRKHSHACTLACTRTHTHSYAHPHACTHARTQT